ncbi:hypothetical protein KXV85_001747, partial [Aspergillus fumigatus]
AGIRRPRRIQGAVGARFALFHRSDAGRRSGRHACDRQGRCDQCRDPSGQRAGAGRSPACDAARRLPPAADRRAEAGRHHRNSRRRSTRPHAGDGGGTARVEMPGVLAGAGFARLRRCAQRRLRRICRCRTAGNVRRRCRRRHVRIRERAGRGRDGAGFQASRSAQPQDPRDHAGPARREGFRHAARHRHRRLCRCHLGRLVARGNRQDRPPRSAEDPA